MAIPIVALLFLREETMVFLPISGWLAGHVSSGEHREFAMASEEM
jgi:hypothetical protein